MHSTLFGIGRVLCDASSQLGVFSLSQNACSQPDFVGSLIAATVLLVVGGLAYRYWQVSAY